MQRWFQLVEKVFCLMCLCYIVQLYYDSRLPIVLFCKIALPERSFKGKGGGDF